MAINAIVTPGSIPEGSCPQTMQELQNVIAQYLQVTFPLTFSGVNYGNTEPAANQRSFPWIRTNSDGSLDGTYIYFNGYWTRPNPVGPEDAGLRFYIGTKASIDTYDGGETGSVSAITGPMWQIATTDGSTPLDDMSNWLMKGRVPVGVSADFVEGGTGGSQTVTLGLINIPPHRHSGGADSDYITSGAGPTGNTVNGWNTGKAGGNTDGTTEPFSVMNPWLAGYWIQRTARIYYKI